MFRHARFLRIASSTHIRQQALSFISTTAPLPQQWRTTADILPLCAAAGSLSATQQAHALAVIHGHLPFSVSISAALILSYANHHPHPSTLQSLFNQTVPFSRSPFLHNTLIRACTILSAGVHKKCVVELGCGDLWSAKKVFDEMPHRDLISWNTCIRVFSDNEYHLESVGLDSEIRIGNALVDAYGKCGNIEALEGVFDQMPERNEVSWNSIIGGLSYKGFNSNALDCFRAMIGERVKLSTVTVATILPTLLELNLFSKGKELHGFCVKMGMDSDVFVANALIDMYGKWNRFLEASYVFDKMDKKNIVSWNTMIGNCAQNGLESNAVQLLREMQARGEIPNSITLTNILPACARLGFLRHGMEIHARSIRLGSAFDLFVSNALTDMYVKCGRLDLAQTIFSISPRDEISYNILITGYSQTSESSNSLSLFTEMIMLGLNLDTISYMGVLSACTNISAIKEGKQIHAFAMRRLFHEHLFIANSLLDMYTKCGRIDIARKVFDRIPKRDTASWNTMILGFGMLGELDTAFELFEAMKNDNNVKYDSVSYIAVMSACSHGGLVEKGKMYFNDMLARNIEPSEMHYACMVDLLGRSGLMEEAMELINSLSIKPGANIWGALLGASRVHGNVDLGCWAAERLLEAKPDNPGYYVLLSNMYAEAGRWDEADRIRKVMSFRKVKKNPGCSWVQIEDQMHGFVAGERFDPYLWGAVST
ncbi:hypothetical protein DH2020_020928 [Rehmannia glutinosa]|uniref:Pentatricopeptide repeat-containing protein n=1 Tax=Rehmannia glutinosa TaxID=99300 RepID=A0ABR0WB73_REHGL